MPNPVIHFEIGGGDGKQLQEFYAQVFSWKVDANNPTNYGMVDTDTGGQGIAGGISPSPGPQPWAMFYIQVNDPQAVLNSIEATGGKTVMPVTDVPGGPAIAQFSDPLGNMVGLVKGM